MEYANVHPIIGNLCCRPEGGVDVEMYRALTRDLSIDEALDLLEMDDVARSWRKATEANAKFARQMEAQRRKR